jgi:hypothetical protein
LNHDSNAEQPFQSLLFLIRDWEYSQQFALGFEGGAEYLAENVFKIKDGHIPEMKQLREYIKGSYKSIKCFLMPHPGKTVAGTKGYDGHWSAIDEIFVEQLKKLIPSMLAPENLSVKKITGDEVTGESLYWNMQFYLQLFVSQILPEPETIYESTVTKFLQEMVSKYVTVYRESISMGSENVTTHTDFNILHYDSKKMTIDSYDKERKIGKDARIVYYRNSLIDQIEEVLNERNRTLYYEIESKMVKRNLEVQHNKTLILEMETADLKRKQEEERKKSEETQKQYQKNLEKLNRQNEKIQNLTDSINQQKIQIEKEREDQRGREKALAAKYEDIKNKLNQQKQDNANLNSTLLTVIKQQEKDKNETDILKQKYDELIRQQEEEKRRLAHLNRIPERAYLKQGDCYLCAQDSKYTENRRKTDCCKSGGWEAEWLIKKSEAEYTTIDDYRYNIKGSYTIMSAKYMRYLYDARYPRQDTLAVRADATLSPIDSGYWQIRRVTNREFTFESPRGKFINRDYTEDEPGRWEIIDLGS